MVSPYRSRPPKSFWKSGVETQVNYPADIYGKRFDIRPDWRIATAGSCFAQHIAVHLRRNGYNVIDTEPPPRSFSIEAAQKFGYRLYSARYGNIYTARQMLQLVQECFGLSKPTDIVWTRGDRFFDALRPNVEPQGLDSADEVLAHRIDHLRRVREVLTTADLLIFTLGLTEAWIHTASGTVYPTAPETIAGQYFPDTYAFKNFEHDEVIADLSELRWLLKQHNPELKFLFTVSPVPLIATASDHHVVVATTYSKSVLRSVAGALYTRFDDVDYFPSYELVATPFFGQNFFKPDRRSVSQEGVEMVMDIFFAAHGRFIYPEECPDARAETPTAAPQPERTRIEELVCEDMLLEAFAP